MRNQKSEVRSQKSEIRNQKSEVRSQIICPLSSVFCPLSSVLMLVLVAAFIFTGCQRKQEEDVVEVLVSGPDVEAISVRSDYAVRAIEAAGGWNAWAGMKELQLDCVVTFYQPDGSFYLTEQHHVVYPWSNSIQISAREPQGAFAWQLSKGKFDVLQDSGQSHALPVVIGSSHFAEMILSIITIPARFLDESAGFSKEATALKIQGQWYYPITRRSRLAVGAELEPARPLSKAVFYQDRDSSLVDMILFDYMSGDDFLAVRGYDYTEVVRMDSQGEKEGVRVPARIEIFKADSQGNLRQRLVKIDYHAMGLVK
ncbi:hypothetical protein ES703_69787 [subsurface metagenome]